VQAHPKDPVKRIWGFRSDSKTQYVTAGSTIELLIAKTDSSTFGYFVGANLPITESTQAVPEPSNLIVGGLGISGFVLAALIRRVRKP
jgi:hypothetical protein